LDTNSGRQEVLMYKNGSSTIDGINYHAFNEAASGTSSYSNNCGNYIFEAKAGDYFYVSLNVTGTSYLNSRGDSSFQGFLVG
jgi:hypothetical protein